ncbi:hypothetical protein FACS189428_4330 [Clostridia bacterium]|nr:hypothetical protein FACS189428_4330 [Clostridia bacterium]
MERDIQVNFDEHEAREYGGLDDEIEVETGGKTKVAYSPDKGHRSDLSDRGRRTRTKPERSEGEEDGRRVSNNPYNNKGKRKRDRIPEEHTKTTRRGNEIKREPRKDDEPRREA